jgi:hypothetical protein
VGEDGTEAQKTALVIATQARISAGQHMCWNVRFGSLAEVEGRVSDASALPQAADITRRGRHVRLVPEADLKA